MANTSFNRDDRARRPTPVIPFPLKIRGADGSRVQPDRRVLAIFKEELDKLGGWVGADHLVLSTIINNVDLGLGESPNSRKLGACWESQEHMAEGNPAKKDRPGCGVSRRTFKNSVKRLKARKLIEVKRRLGKSALIYPLWPDRSQVAAPRPKRDLRRDTRGQFERAVSCLSESAMHGPSYPPEANPIQPAESADGPSETPCTDSARIAVEGPDYPLVAHDPALPGQAPGIAHGDGGHAESGPASPSPATAPHGLSGRQLDTLAELPPDTPEAVRQAYAAVLAEDRWAFAAARLADLERLAGLGAVYCQAQKYVVRLRHARCTARPEHQVHHGLETRHE